jgi:hypothetical protein
MLPFSHSGGWSPNVSTRHVGQWKAYCTCPGWLWWWRIWWNEDWQGKPKYSEKTCPSATLSTTESTWPDPGANPSRRGGKPATNRLSYGAARDVAIINAVCTLWGLHGGGCSGLWYRLVLRADTDISEEHTVSAYTAEVCRVENQFGCIDGLPTLLLFRWHSRLISLLHLSRQFMKSWTQTNFFNRRLRDWHR